MRRWRASHNYGVRAMNVVSPLTSVTVAILPVVSRLFTSTGKFGSRKTINNDKITSMCVVSRMALPPPATSRWTVLFFLNRSFDAEPPVRNFVWSLVDSAHFSAPDDEMARY